MLLLLFHAASDLYAIDSAQVVEIISRVNLQPASHRPDYVVGLFNYRNQIVPVIDLCYLLHQQLSRPYLSTRIMLVKAPTPQNPERCLGLMAERVTETLKVSATLLSTIQPEQNHPYLGTMIQHEKRMIQSILIEGLLATVQAYPFDDVKPTSYPLLSGEECPPMGAIATDDADCAETAVDENSANGSGCRLPN